MNDIAITALLVGALFLILGSGVWIGLTLSGVAWIGMQLFSSRRAASWKSTRLNSSHAAWSRMPPPA